jgi:hypothetical protein
MIRLNPAYEGQLGDTSIGVSFNPQHFLVDRELAGAYLRRERTWFVTRLTVCISSAVRKPLVLNG